MKGLKNVITWKCQM